jgi:large conductance mechanosensitive channel
MGILKEFRDFAMRGNVMDMAIGIIIGAAFGKIVQSLVNDVMMPPLGMLIKGIDFKTLGIELSPAVAATADTPEVPAVVLRYGLFINEVIAFTIVAFAVFMLVKGMNKLKRKQEVAPPKPAETPADVVLLTEIRDLMMRQAR